MKHLYRCGLLLFAFTLLLATACSRYSFELPIPAIPEDKIITVGLNGKQQLRLHFRTRGYAGRDSITLLIENLGPTGFKNLELLLEFSDVANAQYDENKFRHILTVDSLEPNGNSDIIVLSRDSSMLGGNTVINAGILNYNGNRQPFSGDYRSILTTMNQGDSILRYLNAEGYILADGQLEFRIKTITNPPVFYHLKGQLLDSMYLNGVLRQNGNDISPVQLDTLSNGHHFLYDEDTKLLEFRLQLLTPLAEDSANIVHFQLYKY